MTQTKVGNESLNVAISGVVVFIALVIIALPTHLADISADTVYSVICRAVIVMLVFYGGDKLRLPQQVKAAVEPGEPSNRSLGSQSVASEMNCTGRHNPSVLGPDHLGLCLYAAKPTTIVSME